MDATSASDFARRGALYGFLGTLVMSLIMLLGMGIGMSPIPEPIPLAIAKGILGSVAKPLLMIFAIITHFGYGAFWGGVLYQLVKGKGTLWHGLGWGFLLWIVMEIVVLPLLGWGAFGLFITPKIAIATLVLHLVYGGILGWGLTNAEKQEVTPQFKA